MGFGLGTGLFDIRVYVSDAQQGEEEGAGGGAVASGCGHCAKGLADDEDK